MGMAEKKKKLQEFLEDEQVPFHLNHYISDLRSQMGYSNLRLNKRKSNSMTTVHHSLFSCESSCFFASHKSHSPRNSPFFSLLPPRKKKSREGRIFLHIPARTAAILLEAATRIHKQKSEKVKTRSNRFGMFGSVLKLLMNRKSKPRLDNAISLERGSDSTSTSNRRECFMEIDDDECYCESPFHFVLRKTTSSSGHRTSHFTSTATSPARHSTEVEDSDETESLEKVIGQEKDDKDEEDKEQCSPVSVLDPLDEGEIEEDHRHYQHEPEHHLNLLSCSFEVVQRTKRRLLKKLRRFEKLAGLDPIELKMGEEEEEEESEEEDNIRVYDSDEEYEDVDEAMAQEEEERIEKKNDERQKKWRMMNVWRVGSGEEEDVDAIVCKDMKEESGEWTRHGGVVEEVVSELESSIFFFLIDELSHELSSFYS